PRSAGAQPAAASGRDVAGGCARGAARLAGARPLLVDGARGDLLRPSLRAALVQLAVLHVLVLPGALGALSHSAWLHGSARLLLRLLLVGALLLVCAMAELAGVLRLFAGVGSAALARGALLGLRDVVGHLLGGRLLGQLVGLLGGRVGHAVALPPPCAPETTAVSPPVTAPLAAGS